MLKIAPIRSLSYSLKVSFAAVVCAAALSGRATAIDVQALGPTYAIAEQDFLAMIETGLRRRVESGEMSRLMDRAATQATHTVTSPIPVDGVVACQKPRTFYFDPSVVLSKNIFDASGNLIFPAGTRKNPLEVVSLTRPLLFFDARDSAQLDSARRILAVRNMRVKIILTGGSYLSLMRKWRIPVYFDQQGLLVRRLGIQQVPALVTQEGQRLRIEEMLATP